MNRHGQGFDLTLRGWSAGHCEGLRTASLMNKSLLENAGALRRARESLEDFRRSGSSSTRGGFGEQERNDHLASKTWPFILLQVRYSMSSNSKVRHRKQY
jgi:hypothetical protein